MNQKCNEFRRLFNKLCVYLLVALILIMATTTSILTIADIPTKLIFSVSGTAAFVYVASRINEIEKKSCFPNESSYS
jgi:hypothetical protein